jgi:hypothetical protein
MVELANANAPNGDGAEQLPIVLSVKHQAELHF